MSAEVGVNADWSQVRDRECRLRTEEKASDERCRAGSQRHRQEGASADLGQHQLDREHDAADRRVEGRRDTGAGARGDKNDPLPRRHSHDLAQCRSQGRADLDDRALAPHRRAAADRNRRGQRLDDRDDGPDYASFVINRIHDFRYAVAPGLGRELRNEEGNGQRAEHRHQDDEGAPGARRREQVRVVAHRKSAEEQNVVDQANKVAKHDRAKAGHHTDDQSQY